MGLARDNLPDLADLDFMGEKDANMVAFESACLDGPVSMVQSILTSEACAPAFLHHGLTIALSAGNIEIARYLLSAGAPIARQTAHKILSAPSDRQIPLFELLTCHGWTPNTPGYYGEVLLPSIVTNLPLLGWFLTHGANPNHGMQRSYRDRAGGPDTDSCLALERAASHGDVEAVRALLDAGAEIQNGSPLHFAAGVCPAGMNPHVGQVTPSKEFDVGRIPVMALLVERGADVNQTEKTRLVTWRYPIVYAVAAGAVERVRWLLEHGADPEARCCWGNAVQCAWDEEMKSVIAEGIAARSIVKDDTDTKRSE